MKIKRENQHVDQRPQRPSVLITRDTIGQRTCTRQLVSHYMKWLWLFRFPPLFKADAMIFFKSGGLLRSFSRQHEPEKRWKKGELWDQLERNMKIERTKADAKLRGKYALFQASEIVVQRLSVEADNNQTYRPVQPRVFVEFDYEDLSLTSHVLHSTIAKKLTRSSRFCPHGRLHILKFDVIKRKPPAQSPQAPRILSIFPRYEV